MQSLAQKAYGQVQHRTAGPKEIEFAAFQHVTDALEIAAKDSKRLSPETAQAVSRNLELWTILASDLLSETNELPLEVRTSLIGISQFVRTTSMKVLSGSAEIADLIEVNRSIMGGLGGTETPTGEGVE
ncbi:MAG: hypothetical protein Hens3KO_21260 [Henriciella sp.]